MKRSEAATLVAHCKELWGTAFKITPETPDIWAQHAGDLAPTLIQQALDLYASEGRDFPPPLATLMARARGLRPGMNGMAAQTCNATNAPDPHRKTALGFEPHTSRSAQPTAQANTG